MVYLGILGYVYEADTHCTYCAGKRFPQRKKHWDGLLSLDFLLTEDNKEFSKDSKEYPLVDSEGNVVTAIYPMSRGDFPCGVWCGDCGGNMMEHDDTGPKPCEACELLWYDNNIVRLPDDLQKVVAVSPNSLYTTLACGHMDFSTLLEDSEQDEISKPIVGTRIRCIQCRYDRVHALPDKCEYCDDEVTTARAEYFVAIRRDVTCEACG
jgi:hypothetical protein